MNLPAGLPRPRITSKSLARWRALWGELGAASVDEALHGKVVACYSEPHRHYHTLRHLEECFAHFRSVDSLA